MLADELRFQVSHRLDKLPRGVVHADLFRDNCLFEITAGVPRVGGIIDFYFAGNDVLLFDVAVTVNDWCSDTAGELDTARTSALLAAYHAERPLNAAEKVHGPPCCAPQLCDSGYRGYSTTTCRDPAKSSMRTIPRAFATFCDYAWLPAMACRGQFELLRPIG